jgi:hypothetical protein
MRRMVGLFLVGAGIAAGVGSTVLAAVFEWPDRLDDPAAVALPAFAADATAIRFGFALQLLGSLLMIPGVIGLGRLVGRSTVGTRVLTVFGVAGALIQTLGWVRWPIVVPVLAREYLATAPDSPERAAIGAGYDLLNAYAGGALGEHLGWLLQGVWALGVGVHLLSAGVLPKWYAWLGTLLTVAWLPPILAAGYTASHTNAVAMIGSVTYTVWFLWVTAAGVLLVVRPGTPAPGTAAVPDLPGKTGRWS